MIECALFFHSVIDRCRFLEYENILHCVPGNVSSGLANLPLSHVYFNGTKTNTSTIPFLPTGEKLDGRKMYQKLLRFHTTTNLTADEVYELGWKNMKRDYLQVMNECLSSFHVALQLKEYS